MEANLASLRVERMDLVNLRLADEHGAPDVPLPEQLGVLEEMRAEGELDLIGISNVSLDGVRRALELVEIAEGQNAYSIIDRAHEPILDLGREQAIAFVPFFPLGSAFSGGPGKIAADPAIAAVAAKHDATPSQIALAWLLDRYERMLLIPGTASVAHLEEHLAAADVVLDDGDVHALASVGERRPPLH